MINNKNFDDGFYPNCSLIYMRGKGYLSVPSDEILSNWEFIKYNKYLGNSRYPFSIIVKSKADVNDVDRFVCKLIAKNKLDLMEFMSLSNIEKRKWEIDTFRKEAI